MGFLLMGLLFRPGVLLDQMWWVSELVCFTNHLFLTCHALPLCLCVLPLGTSFSKPKTLATLVTKLSTTEKWLRKDIDSRELAAHSQKLSVLRPSIVSLLLSSSMLTSFAGCLSHSHFGPHARDEQTRASAELKKKNDIKTYLHINTYAHIRHLKARAMGDLVTPYRVHCLSAFPPVCLSVTFAFLTSYCTY